MTHTYATLEVTAAAYDEIAAKLREAGYGHAFDVAAIDMHGIGLLRKAPMQRCDLCGYQGTETDHIGQCPRCHWDELCPNDGALQARVEPWLLACFGVEIAGDKIERNHRFLEEALELVQACGCTADEAHQLVDYTFGRPVGEPFQEAGGVMITLAALCLANGLDMHEAGETELARIWTKVEQIRAKQAAKPKHSPLPQPPAAQTKAEAERDALRAFAQGVMRSWPHGDVDGGDLQALAQQHGLLRPETRTERCGEVCNCAEMVSADEWAAGVECFRRTPLLTGKTA